MTLIYLVFEWYSKHSSFFGTHLDESLVDLLHETAVFIVPISVILQRVLTIYNDNSNAVQFSCPGDYKHQLS